MRTRFFPIVLLGVIAFSACFSGQEKKESESQNLQDSVTTSEPIAATAPNNVLYNVEEEVGPTIKQGEEESRPSYKVRIDLNLDNCPEEALEPVRDKLRYIFNGKESQSLNEAVMAFGDNIRNTYRASLVEIYTDTTAKLDFAYEFLYEAEGCITTDSRADIIPYKLKISSYEGGAHGGYYEQWFNFDRNTGKFLTHDQVFNMDKEEAIKDIIRQQICVDNQCKDLETLQETTSILLLGDVFLSDYNFQLGKDAVEILFNPYEIAPWSAGTIYVKIPYSALDGLLR